MVNYRRRGLAGRKSSSRSSAVDPEPLSSVEKEAIKESLEGIKCDRVYTLEEVKKEPGFYGIFHTIFFLGEEGFENLPENVVEKILENLEYISSDLHSHVKKLKGNPFFSNRIGKYRLILEIIDDGLIIHIISVAHRSKVYRNF